MEREERIDRMAELIAQRAKRMLGVPRDLHLAEPNGLARARGPLDPATLKALAIQLAAALPPCGCGQGANAISIPRASVASLVEAAKRMLLSPESPDAWAQLQRAVNRIGLTQ
jgi:hypothetical protein